MAKTLTEKIRNLEKKVDNSSESSKYCPEHRKKLKYHGNDTFGNSIYRCQGPPVHHIVCRDEKSGSLNVIGKEY